MNIPPATSPSKIALACCVLAGSLGGIAAATLLPEARAEAGPARRAPELTPVAAERGVPSGEPSDSEFAHPASTSPSGPPALELSEDERERLARLAEHVATVGPSCDPGLHRTWNATVEDVAKSSGIDVGALDALVEDLVDEHLRRQLGLDAEGSPTT